MSILRVTDIDIAEAVAALPEFDDIWQEERFRQELSFTPSSGIDRIWLRRQPGSRPRDLMHQLASVATRHYCNAAMAWLIYQVCAEVEGRPARALLLRLGGGASIERHADIGIYADAVERFHVPLVTNRAATFSFTPERYHMAAGGVYAIDMHSEHSASNGGDEAVVHLVVDVHPNSTDVLA